MLQVHISNRQGRIEVDRPRLVKIVRLAAPGEWEDSEVSVAVVDGEQMAALNRKHTGRTGETDVLAFHLDDLVLPNDKLLGEIVVSAGMALAEAKARRVSPEDELALYVLHGVLHLAGLDDHSAAARREMYAREKEVCAAADVPYTRACARKSSLRAQRRKRKARRTKK